MSNKINSDDFLNVLEYSEEKLNFKKPYDRLCYKQKARRLNHITSAIIANCHGDINELRNCAYETILHDNTLAKKVILLLMDIRYDLEKKFQLNIEKVDINENIDANELLADYDETVRNQHIKDKGDDISVNITGINPETEECNNVGEVLPESQCVSVIEQNTNLVDMYQEVKNLMNEKHKTAIDSIGNIMFHNLPKKAYNMASKLMNESYELKKPNKVPTYNTKRKKYKIFDSHTLTLSNDKEYMNDKLLCDDNDLEAIYNKLYMSDTKIDDCQRRQQTLSKKIPCIICMHKRWIQSMC